MPAVDLNHGMALIYLVSSPSRQVGRKHLFWGLSNMTLVLGFFLSLFLHHCSLSVLAIPPNGFKHYQKEQVWRIVDHWVLHLANSWTSIARRGRAVSLGGVSLQCASDPSLWTPKGRKSFMLWWGSLQDLSAPSSYATGLTLTSHLFSSQRSVAVQKQRHHLISYLCAIVQ